MDIYLATERISEDGHHVTGKKPLTQEEYDKLKEALLEIHERNKIRTLHKIIENNHSDFIDFCEITLHELMTHTSTLMEPRQDEMSSSFMDANRLLLNYLASIKMFIDHSKTSVARRFRDPKMEEALKTDLSQKFDTQFAYRFLTQLRNYALHCGLPIGSISFVIDVYTKTASLQITFDPPNLLKEYNSWSRIVKDELSSRGNEPIDVIPLMNEMATIMESVRKQIELFNQSRLRQAAVFIDEITREHRMDEGELSLYHFRGGEDENRMNVRREQIPFDTIDEILQEMKAEGQHVTEN